MENINNSILDNPYIANSWWLLSNENVVRDRMEIKDGEFAWKDNDEKNNRKKFWIKIAEDVDKTPITTNNIKFLLKQYCERFHLYEKDKLYQWIKTAYRRKDEIGKECKWRDESGNIDNMGVITDKEIEDIIRYTFQWNVMSSGRLPSIRLPEEMKRALKAFQDKFRNAFKQWTLKEPRIISEVFGIENEWNISPLALWSRNTYNRTVTWREYNNDDDDQKEKNRVKRHFMSWNFINQDIANMEKKLKSLSSNDYRPVTTSVLNNLRERLEIE